MAKLQKINLDELPEFAALDPKRQAVARGISQGVTFTRACSAVGLNATRERKNEKLQRVLWLLQMGPDPSGEPAAGQLDVYECARRLGWLLGDDTCSPRPEVENIAWVLDSDDWLCTELGIREVSARPARLTADQIASYRAHVEKLFPREGRSVCSFCGKTVYHRRVCDECLPKCRCGQATCPAPQCRDAAQPTPAAYVQPSRPVVEVPVMQTGKCSRCPATTPAGVGLCDSCAVGVNW